MVHPNKISTLEVSVRGDLELPLHKKYFVTWEVQMAEACGMSSTTILKNSPTVIAGTHYSLKMLSYIISTTVHSLLY